MTTDVIEKFEMDRRIQRVFNRVWDYIAYDCLNTIAHEKGKPIGAITMSRKHVIEVCWDYIDTYGEDPEACAALRAMPEKEQNKVIKAGFPYATFGY